MKTSQAGINLIKQFEGFRAKAYKCPAGVVTIGYGHTGKELTMADMVTQERAEQILKHDIEWAEDAVNAVRVPLSQNQFDGLVSLVFNIGAPKFSKSILLEALNAGKYEEAAAQFARWNKVKGKPNAGLTRRRAAEAALFMQSSDVMEMPQAVDSPTKPLAKSRTIANASTAGIVGTALAAAPAIEPAGKVVEIVQNNTQGFLIVLGIVLGAFAAVAIYIKISERRSA